MKASPIADAAGTPTGSGKRTNVNVMNSRMDLGYR